MSAAERVWRPGWPCPVRSIAASLRHGRGDPTYRHEPDGELWRGLRTPVGTATLRVSTCPRHGEVRAAAWGEGAAWALDRLPSMLGAADDATGFEPHHHPVVAEGWRRHPHWRVPSTGLVMESLVPAVIEQKVTGKEAFASWRTLVRRYGEPAPGAGADAGLWVMPAPRTLLAIPSWEWLAMNVTPARSRTVAVAARSAAALERLADVAWDEADRRLRSLPGVGIWTSAEVRARALGDPDAVSFGDFHVAKDVGWALTGTPTDDEGMARLLEPFRPHRLRVVVVLALMGLHRPRRGPRMTLPTHLPAASSAPRRLRGAGAGGPGRAR